MVAIACPCPKVGGESRHQSDEVTLRERLGFVEASSIRKRIGLRRASLGEDEDLETDEILAVLTEGYILHGVESWTLENEDGPIPVTRGNIRTYILDRWDIAVEVADAADDMYSEAVMLPLLNQASTSSPPSPMPDSTSASPPSGTPAPRPLRPSSTSTTPTDDTATTSESPAGDSKSSRSSTSAA